MKNNSWKKVLFKSHGAKKFLLLQINGEINVFFYKYFLFNIL